MVHVMHLFSRLKKKMFSLCISPENFQLPFTVIMVPWSVPATLSLTLCLEGLTHGAAFFPGITDGCSHSGCTFAGMGVHQGFLESSASDSLILLTPKKRLSLSSEYVP